MGVVFGIESNIETKHNVIVQLFWELCSAEQAWAVLAVSIDQFIAKFIVKTDHFGEHHDCHKFVVTCLSLIARNEPLQLILEELEHLIKC